MIISTLKKFVLAVSVLAMSAGSILACNFSHVVPLNIVRIGPLPNGPWVISFSLCVGMGRNGTTQGGDQITTSFFAGFYDSQPGFAISAFTPNPLLGPAVGVPAAPCPLDGSIDGPNPGFGTQDQVTFVDPSAYGFSAPCSQHGYGCVNSTILCGNIQSYCRTITVTVNQIPDSMRVFGIEAGGNPHGGCRNNADMMINFNAFLSLVWGEFQAIPSPLGINLTWSTMKETDSDYFIVERATGSAEFAEIAQVPATGNSSIPMDYAYMDPSPAPGQNRYRIVQVDRLGQFNDSEIIEVDYFQPSGLSWGAVGPNPTSGHLGIAYYSPKREVLGLEVRDVNGRLVASATVDAIQGGNVIDGDLSTVDAGVYYLSLQGKGDKITRKVTKL